MKAQLITKPTLSIHCPDCPHLAKMTTWKPIRGFDRGVRKYRCPFCKAEYYLVFVDLKELADFADKWGDEFLLD